MLCEYSLRGTAQEQAAAGYEAQRRNLDCVAMYRAEAARRQQRIDATNQAMRLLAPPPQINCTTTNTGGGISQTNCR
jgi:hypothetical protein